jgi:predicted PolB exonuclease-like 3'-5' exonuclease
MALLGFHQPRNNVSLDDAARLMGFPGKLGMDGSQVWQAFCAGRIAQIRAYCETDALNTYLIHLRFQRMRGMLDEAQYRSCIGQLRHRLASQAEAHWTEFLAAWPENDAAPS